MPTYEYACRSCGAHVEVYQRFSDPPLTECGVCGGPLRKVFHPAGILFKGSGFYATDSRRGARAGGGGGEDGRSGGKEHGAKEPAAESASKPKPAERSGGDSSRPSAATSTKESA